MRCAMCGNEALPGQQFCRDHRGGGRANTARTAGGSIEDVYATFWQRAAASIIDALASSVVGAFITAAIGAAMGIMIIPLAWLIVYIAYYAGFESSALQATPGKLAIDIKVTTAQGERIGFGRAVGRLLAKFLSSILLIGYLMTLFTDYRQGLHDRLAGTLVVRKRFSPEEIADAGPAPSTSGGVVAAVIILVVFGGIFIVGILAAISIPAYQDYTVRAQITEGLNAAFPYKAAIAEAHAEGKPLAEISSDTLKFPPATLRYVSSVEVEGGRIVITYGGQANRAINGQILSILPAEAKNGAIVWVCGHQAPPPDATFDASAASRGTTIVQKYLPRNCRAGG